MRIRDFFSTLNFSISSLNDRNNEDVRNFEDNFDEIMESSIEYIRRLVEEREDELSDSYTMDDIVLDDYEFISNETYQNADVYPISMKYIASKYLNSHRYLIPELEKEIEERGLFYTEEESYTDDFHENLLTALLSLKEDYKENYGNLVNELPEEVASILRVGTDEAERDAAFKKLYSQFGNASMVPFNIRRNVMMMGYYSLYGLQGVEDNSAPQSVLKIKNAFHMKDYIQSYVERLEPVYKNELVNSILSTIYQLDRFGKIYEKIEAHNDRMKRFGLHGLGYQSDENEIYPNLPKFEDIMTEDNLSRQNIDDLLMLNAFYNNRFAKTMNEYALALFVIGNLDVVKECVNGKNITKKSLGQSMLNMLVTKYQTLILPIKAFFIEEQSKIQNDPYIYLDRASEVDFGTEDGRVKKQIELRPDDFIKKVCKAWRNDYRDYYNDRLPGIDNNLEDDLAFTNTLYNPIFLSYSFKHDSIKAVYAYLHFLSKEDPKKSLNFGLVENSIGDNRRNNILLAFDGLLNSTVRLHIDEEAFADFLVAQTGSANIRIFEGFEDFYYGSEYISSQLVAPQCKQHTKFMKGLKNGSVSKENPSAKITPMNEKFVEHMEYNMNKTKFMQSHKITMAKTNKKGKVIKELVQPIRYYNLDELTRYIQMENGELIEEKELEVIAEYDDLEV